MLLALLRHNGSLPRGHCVNTRSPCFSHSQFPPAIERELRSIFAAFFRSPSILHRHRRCLCVHSTLSPLALWLMVILRDDEWLQLRFQYSGRRRAPSHVALHIDHHRWQSGCGQHPAERIEKRNRGTTIIKIMNTANTNGIQSANTKRNNNNTVGGAVSGTSFVCRVRNLKSENLMMNCVCARARRA